MRTRGQFRTRLGWLAAAIGGYVLILPAGPQNPQAPGGARGVGGFIAYPQRPITDPEAVARGKVQFDVNCSFCHGADARGGDDGPNLLRSQLVLDDEKGESIGPVLLNGRDRGMPKFTLTGMQISDIAAYIHSFPVSSRTGPSTMRPREVTALTLLNPRTVSGLLGSSLANQIRLSSGAGTKNQESPSL